MEHCIVAVEDVFRRQGEGKIPASEILGVKAPNGGLHVKAALLPNDHSYLVAKLNTNFPRNGRNFRLPTIQGVIVVCDAENGAPLAIMDSIEITIMRTRGRFGSRGQISRASEFGDGNSMRLRSAGPGADASIERGFQVEEDSRF